MSSRLLFPAAACFGEHPSGLAENCFEHGVLLFKFPWYVSDCALIVKGFLPVLESMYLKLDG